MGVELNAAGDVIVSRSDQLQALAEPAGLRVFDALQRTGPVAASELASNVELDNGLVEATLKRLLAAGLADRNGDRWTAPGSGMLISIPADLDEPGLRAGRSLYRTMIEQNLQRVIGWVSEDLGSMSGAQLRSSGATSATVRMTEDEIDNFQQQVDQLLLPYLDSRREPADGTSSLRLSLFVMPQPDPRADDTP
ncbi:winged helix-turn-helix domain-containing protein [Microlunatus soli]|uniref:Uncharacterized protein n=1 Tax=Microlunatus soli TaxID=630515 RepID=A0A1H1MTR0_9ACTN|nr:helix-turn-helix domain-containing protein [Microlunatus soli]SDR90271.1 hypothetical protein SAMN04489812_0263 [Microlunatus soli]